MGWSKHSNSSEYWHIFTYFYYMFTRFCPLSSIKSWARTAGIVCQLPLMHSMGMLWLCRAWYECRKFPYAPCVERSFVFVFLGVDCWYIHSYDMGVSRNMGNPPKSSILIDISIINHPFWGVLPLFLETPICWNEHNHQGYLLPLRSKREKRRASTIIPRWWEIFVDDASNMFQQ